MSTASCTLPLHTHASLDAIGNDPADPAMQELHTLRAALDVRLRTLEAALADPNYGGSLEILVLDLARVATEEAETAAARAILNARELVTAARAEAEALLKSIDGERAVASALNRNLEEAQLGLAAERETGRVLRRELDEARSELDTERVAATALGRDLEKAQLALASERETGRALRRELDEARAELDTGRVAATTLGRGLEKAQLALASERETGRALREDLERAQTVVNRLERDVADKDAGHQVMAAELEAIRNAARVAEAEFHTRDQMVREAAERIRDLEVALMQRDIKPHEQAVDLSRLLEAEGPVLAPVEQPPSSSPDVANLPDVPVATDAPLYAGQPARCATRHAFNEEIEVQIDGGSVKLVDLSTTGAQVIAPTALRPNRAVRVVLPLGNDVVACKGRIVWARLEPARRGGFHYRAGICFTSVDESAVEAFLARHLAARRVS